MLTTYYIVLIALIVLTTYVVLIALIVLTTYYIVLIALIVLTTCRTNCTDHADYITLSDPHTL